MDGLTSRQSEVLTFICEFTQKNGFPPTLREMGAFFSMAASSILEHLRALERKGYIRRTPYRSRNLEVLKKAA